MIERLIAWWQGPAHLIERAELTDCADMAELHASGFTHDWGAEEIASFLRQTGVFALVARRIGRGRGLAGFVLVRAVADEAEILTIAVDPRQQGRGIGRKLMDAAFRRLYHDRIAQVFLEVDEGNPPALALYRRLGFQKVGERKGYYANGSAPGAGALVMKAVLG